MPASAHAIPKLHHRGHEGPPQWFVDILRELNYQGQLVRYVQAAIDRVVWPEHRARTDHESYYALGCFLLPEAERHPRERREAS